MARSPYTDYLQVFPFWLMDVGPADSISLPLLTPVFGFASISVPEISFDNREVEDGTAPFKRKVMGQGSVSNITLTQGLTFYNYDFGRWAEMAAVGETAPADLLVLGPTAIGGPTFRRDLLLIQYFAHTNFAPPRSLEALVAFGATAAGFALAANTNVALGTTLALGAAAAVAAVARNVGPFEVAARVPARAWMLRGCIPARYKAGSDFDAASSAVSVAELEISVDYVDEYALGSGAAYGAPVLGL